MKPKRFGENVMALTYSDGGDRRQRAGLSINLSGRMSDEFDGTWVRLPEAKELVANLQAAIEHLESKKRKRKETDA